MHNYSSREKTYLLKMDGQTERNENCFFFKNIIFGKKNGLKFLFADNRRKTPPKNV